MVVVCKFGGSSLADAESAGIVKEIVESSSSRRYVVVSAMGSVAVGQRKVTDLLYEISESSRSAEEEVILRHEEFCRGVGYRRCEKMIDEVFGKIHKIRDREYAASRGEYMMARIMSEVLGMEFVDGKDVISFREGKWDVRGSIEKAKRRLEGVEKAVIAGFYGEDENGRIRTLSRGGSDITGAVIANAVDADLYENWTDADGFLAVDPHLSESRLIECLSYDELTLLSYYGAGVLHYLTTRPLILKAIPVVIKNTFNRNAQGTVISYEKRKGFKGVAVCELKMYEIEGVKYDEIRDLRGRYKIFDGTSKIYVLSDDKGFAKRLIEAGKVTRINIRDVAVAAAAGCAQREYAEVIIGLTRNKIPIYAAESMSESFLVVTGRVFKEQTARIIYETLDGGGKREK